jgi:hypothetical protein
MVHVLQHKQSIGDNLMGRLPLYVADETDAAGVMLEARIVQTLGRRKTVHRMPKKRLPSEQTQSSLSYRNLRK